MERQDRPTILGHWCPSSPTTNRGTARFFHHASDSRPNGTRRWASWVTLLPRFYELHAYTPYSLFLDEHTSRVGQILLFLLFYCFRGSLSFAIYSINSKYWKIFSKIFLSEKNDDENKIFLLLEMARCRKECSHDFAKILKNSTKYKSENNPHNTGVCWQLVDFSQSA